MTATVLPFACSQTDGQRKFSLITAEWIFTINRRNFDRWKKELLTLMTYSTLFLPIRISSFPPCTHEIGPSLPVQFLKHLKLAWVDLTSAHIPCDLTRSGGFSPYAGAVVLCKGNFLIKKHDMKHPLYDHTVFE